MAAWIVVACLQRLRDEFNTLSPGRDKGADGTIGDAAHAAESSDHNPDDTPGVRTPFTDADTTPEVHALDIDCTGPWPGSFDGYVETIRLRHQSGRDVRLQNIIWRGRVASRSWGWTWQDRPGIGHFDHAHFSARYTTEQERDVSPWGILEEDVMDQTEFNALMDAYAERLSGLNGSSAAQARLRRNWIALVGVDERMGDIVRRYDDAGNWVPDTDPNPRMTVASAVEYLGVNTQRIKVLVEQLGSAVDQVDEAVWSKISDPATPDEQVAGALVQLLGDRAPAVIALMQPYIA